MNDHVKEIDPNESYKPIEFPWLPGYFIKRDIRRIEAAKAFSDCIKEHKLNHLMVPEKWVYKIPVPELKDTYKANFVVAKKLKGTHTKMIPLDHVKQFCILLNNAKYNSEYGECIFWDLKQDNLLSCDDGRTAFIDTELAGFAFTRKQQSSLLMGELKSNGSLDEQAKELIIQEVCQD